MEDTSDPSSPGKIIPSGFPEIYTGSLMEMQRAISALGVAIRSHQTELRRTLSNPTPHEIENHQLAVTISADNLTVCLMRVEEAQAKVHAQHDLVGSALVRCESYDAANP